MSLFCHAYGIDAGPEVVAATIAAVALNVDRLRAEVRLSDAEWWQAQLDWLNLHRNELEARL